MDGSSSVDWHIAIVLTACLAPELLCQDVVNQEKIEVSDFAGAQLVTFQWLYVA